MRGVLARLMPVVRPVIGVLIVAAVGYAVASQWAEVTEAIGEMHWLSIALAFLMVLLGSAAALMSWRILLAEEGHPLGFVDAARIFFVGQLGKYLPGSVWSIVVQMELATRLKVPRARTFTATLCWTGLSLASALTVGVIGLPFLGADTAIIWVLLPLLPVALVCSHPAVLTKIVDRLLGLIRKPPLPHVFTWRGVRGAFGWLLVTWLCYGTHLWLLANSLGTPGLLGFVRCLSGFALALGAGIVFIVAPSGAGAREALIVGALAGVMSRGEALGVAVVSRMLFTVADIALAGVAALSALRVLRHGASPTTGEVTDDAPATHATITGPGDIPGGPTAPSEHRAPGPTHGV
ncbi:lysylphosphatidylglycerol synthase transmembrane domain-containing protein [Humibacillus sp. DSM 29435]|uniref:lysylphosphatidylglycerol synthase transmembrane domain-containing protein n=1 Tax=Humibacillus sp. DSM 29435 TaxID=1869167 RepID=UPI0015865CED|nr:lysylphosphatidylglycerol synthase transmembrane domain-containing protein [Humibacillus sp. DSM 29435]